MDKNVNTFNKESSKYQLSRPVYPKRIYEYLSKLVINNDCAWDSACGTGQVATSLINYFAEVKATDINENQIKNAKSNEKISYSVQPSEKTNFEDNTFDLICVAQALHWFKIESFFNEAKRVLKKSGVFSCWGYSFFSINSEIDNVVNRTIFKPIKPYWSEKNYILWNKYKNINFPFKKVITPKFEMKQEWSKEELINYIRTWSAYKRFIEDEKRNLEADFYNSVRQFWPDDDKKQVVMDFTFYAGRNV